MLAFQPQGCFLAQGSGFETYSTAEQELPDMAEHQKQQPWIPPASSDAADPAAAAVVAAANAAAAAAVPGPPTPDAGASHFVGQQQQQLHLQGAGVPADAASAVAAAAAASAGAPAAVVVEGRSIRLNESVCPVHVQAVYCYSVSETDDSALKVCMWLRVRV